MIAQPSPYHRHRFPGEVISHAVWLYHLLSLSLRDIELILAERGVGVTQESIRHWCRKFGAEFAERLRRRRPRHGDGYHMEACHEHNSGQEVWSCTKDEGGPLGAGSQVQAPNGSVTPRALSVWRGWQHGISFPRIPLNGG